MKVKRTEIDRVSISLPKTLLEKFDQLIEKKGYENRSEALRDLIRDLFVEEEWNEDVEVAATVTLVYEHNTTGILDKLTNIEHENLNNIVSTMHIHIDKENCLEVIALRGKASVVKSIGEKIISIKGVKYGKIVKATTGKNVD